MPIEYDLVIIGATELGCRMARRAASIGARVALVEQSVTPEPALRYRAVIRAPWPAIPADDQASWLDLKVQDDALELSAESLQIAGVDYIANGGTFVQKPIHGFQVADRLLRSSHYISALQGDRIVPLGLGHIDCLRPESIVNQWFELKGQRVAIVGERPVGVELAMALRSSGAEVMLVVPTPQILPLVKRTFSDRVQMGLEVAGVEVWVGQSYESQSIRDRIAHCDTIVLATPKAKLLPKQFGLRSLNRSAMKQNRLQLVIHGDDLTDNVAAIAQVGVEKILKPWSQRTMKSSGHLAGLAAAWVHGPIVPSKKQTTTQKIIDLQGVSLDEGRLWYQIGVTQAGRIVEAYFVGDRAIEWSGIISLAIAAKMSLLDLVSLALPDGTQSALASHWLEEWELQARSPLWHELYLDWLGFIRRRSTLPTRDR